jgi:hypothetical protein
VALYGHRQVLLMQRDYKKPDISYLSYLDFCTFQGDDLETKLEDKRISGQISLESSPYEGTQIGKEIVQTGPFVFELSAIFLLFQVDDHEIDLKGQ